MSQGNCASEASTTTAASVAPARSSTALKPLARTFVNTLAKARMQVVSAFYFTLVCVLWCDPAFSG